MTRSGQGAGVVRDATSDDAAACAAIYFPYVTGTASTFETDPPGREEMAGRIAAAQATHAWLVLTTDSEVGTGSGAGTVDSGAVRVVGYAYAGPFRTRPAYRWTCEVSVYLAGDHTGRGGGRRLYTALLERLADRGYRTATAAMVVPNPASAALHAALGFQPVGVFRDVGWKAGGWRDVQWMQLRLPDRGPRAADPSDGGAVVRAPQVDQPPAEPR